MKAFFACVKKDLLLFRSGAGLLALLLPVALLLALGAFMGGTAAARGYVEPFPIAVRDEDGSPMSRSLVRQMGEIALFSEVREAGADETDEALISGGAACVLTIPQDYFYRVYAMDECTVGIVLNGDMPLQSALVESMVTNILDIISADQQAASAVYALEYGSLSEEQARALCADAAEDILRDALGRQSIFDTESEAEDTAAQLRLSFFVCAVSLTCMFLPLVTLKTLPEELEMGILPRYVAAGGSLPALLLSKLVSALALSVLPTACLVVFARPGGGIATVAVLLLALLSSFAVFLLLSVLIRDEARPQLIGNLLILFELAVGGVLYPLELLPAPLQAAAPFTLPYYVLCGVRAAAGGAGLSGVLSAVWPLAAALAAAVPAVLLLQKRRRV